MLLGPSDSEKSTVIRLITGLTKPDKGVINWNREALSVGKFLQFRQSIGYMIQEGYLFPHLTVEQNITLVPNYSFTNPHMRWVYPKPQFSIKFIFQLSHHQF